MMKRDFAESYSSARGRKQNIASRAPGEGRGSGRHRWLWRASGAVLMTATAIGIAGSLWFGHLIRSGLDELTLKREQIQDLQQLGKALDRQRAQLLAKEEIEAAARKMGLFPPAASQIQRP